MKIGVNENGKSIALLDLIPEHYSGFHHSFATSTNLTEQAQVEQLLCKRPAQLFGFTWCLEKSRAYFWFFQFGAGNRQTGFFFWVAVRIAAARFLLWLYLLYSRFADNLTSSEICRNRISRGNDWQANIRLDGYIRLCLSAAFQCVGACSLKRRVPVMVAFILTLSIYLRMQEI